MVGGEKRMFYTDKYLLKPTQIYLDMVAQKCVSRRRSVVPVMSVMSEITPCNIRSRNNAPDTHTHNTKAEVHANPNDKD